MNTRPAAQPTQIGERTPAWSRPGKRPGGDTKADRKQRDDTDKLRATEAQRDDLAERLKLIEATKHSFELANQKLHKAIEESEARHNVITNVTLCLNTLLGELVRLADSSPRCAKFDNQHAAIAINFGEQPVLVLSPKNKRLKERQFPIEPDGRIEPIILLALVGLFGLSREQLPEAAREVFQHLEPE